MDLTSATILTGAAWGAIALVLVVLAWIFTGGDVDKIPAGPRAIVCLIVCPAVVLLVSISEWADTVRLTPGAEPLDRISIGGLLLVGLFLAILEAGAFAVLDRITNGLANAGIPMPSAKQRAMADKAADQYARAQLPDAGGAPAHGDTTTRPPSTSDLDRGPGMTVER